MIVCQILFYLKEKKTTHHQWKTHFEWHQYRCGLFAAKPFFCCCGRLVWQRVRIQILLKQFGSPWHCHRYHLAQSIIVQPIKFGNFAGVHVTATFRHHANATLWIRWLILIDVMNEWWFRCDLNSFFFSNNNY